MKRRQLKIAPVVGQPSEKVWAQVAILPENLSRGELLFEEVEGGVLVVALSVWSNSDDVSEMGRKILAEINREYYGGDLKLKGGEKLYRLVEKMVGFDGLKFELVGVVFDKSEISVVSYGKGRVALSREGKVGMVSEGVGNNIQAMEGKWEVGDKWLIGTSGLVGEMSKQLVEELMGFDDVVLAGEELAIQVQSVSGSEGAAGLLIQVAEKEVDVIESNKEVEVNGDDISLTGKTGVSEVLKKPQVYLKDKKKKKVAMSVGIVLLFLLGISVVLGWKKRQDVLWRKRYEGVYLEAKDLVEAADLVIGENPIQARSLLVQARERLEVGIEDFNEREKEKEMLENYLNEVREKYSVVAGENYADELPVWFDLGVIREDMFGEKMVLFGEKMAVLDSKREVVGVIDIESKQAELVGGGELMKKVKDIAFTGTRILAVAEVGVVDILVSNKTADTLIEKEDDWVDVREIGAYGGNVYVLDAGEDELWRYAGVSNGVGSRRRWFGPGVEPELGGVVDMAIDGDLYLLDSSGEVMKFRRGALMKYEITQLDRPIKDAVAIATNEEGEGVYILDRGNRRVVVADKEGVYKQQYLWDGLAGVSDLAVSEETKQAFLLSGTTIYVMDLK